MATTSQKKTRGRGAKPPTQGNVCTCSAPCIDYEPEWTMRPGAHYDPNSTSGDIPDRYYDAEVWTPVCYPVTPARYTSREYYEHVLRLAEHGDHRTGEPPDPEAAAIIRRKIADL